MIGDDFRWLYGIGDYYQRGYDQDSEYARLLYQMRVQAMQNHNPGLLSTCKTAEIKEIIKKQSITKNKKLLLLGE